MIDTDSASMKDEGRPSLLACRSRNMLASICVLRAFLFFLTLIKDICCTIIPHWKKSSSSGHNCIWEKMHVLAS